MKRPQFFFFFAVTIICPFLCKWLKRGFEETFFFSFFQSVALPRTPVREIGNVTICGLWERRNETVSACKIKITGWRRFKKTVKQWWPNNRSRRTGFLWYYEWALALMASWMTISALLSSPVKSQATGVFTPPVPLWKSHIAADQYGTASGVSRKTTISNVNIWNMLHWRQMLPVQ